MERNVKIKQKGKTYSLNEGYAKYFHPSINEYLKHKKYPEVRGSVREADENDRNRSLKSDTSLTKISCTLRLRLGKRSHRS